MQLLLQPDNVAAGQAFRLQVTDAPDVVSIVTTPKPETLPPAFESTELTLPFCGPGADFNDHKQLMTWKASNMFTITDFVDFSGGITTYRRVNMSGVVWSNGTAVEIAGGVGIVEVYHR